MLVRVPAGQPYSTQFEQSGDDPTMFCLLARKEEIQRFDRGQTMTILEENVVSYPCLPCISDPRLFFLIPAYLRLDRLDTAIELPAIYGVSTNLSIHDESHALPLMSQHISSADPLKDPGLSRFDDVRICYGKAIPLPVRTNKGHHFNHCKERGSLISPRETRPWLVFPHDTALCPGPTVDDLLFPSLRCTEPFLALSSLRKPHMQF